MFPFDGVKPQLSSLRLPGDPIEMYSFLLYHFSRSIGTKGGAARQNHLLLYVATELSCHAEVIIMLPV